MRIAVRRMVKGQRQVQVKAHVRRTTGGKVVPVVQHQANRQRAEHAAPAVPVPLQDASGGPLTLYQGNDASTMHTDPSGGSEHGIYLTPRRGYAERYGRNLHKTWVALANPLVVDNKGEISPRDLTAEDIARLAAKGHDGIIVKSAGQGVHQASEIVVFDRSSLIEHGDVTRYGAIREAAREAPTPMVKGAQLALFGAGAQQQVQVRPHTRRTKGGKVVPVVQHQAHRAKAAPKAVSIVDLPLEELATRARRELRSMAAEIIESGIDTFVYPKRGAVAAESYLTFTSVLGGNAGQEFRNRKPREVPAEEIRTVSAAERPIFRQYVEGYMLQRQGTALRNRLDQVVVGKAGMDTTTIGDLAWHLQKWVDDRVTEAARRQITPDNTPDWVTVADGQVLVNLYAAPPEYRARLTMRAWEDLLDRNNDDLLALVREAMEVANKREGGWTTRERLKHLDEWWLTSGRTVRARLEAASQAAHGSWQQDHAMIKAAEVRGDDWYQGNGSWREMLWGRRLAGFRDYVVNEVPHEGALPGFDPASGDYMTPMRAVENRMDDLDLARHQGGEIRGEHWGTVTAHNRMAVGVCALSGNGILRPVSDFHNPVDVLKGIGTDVAYLAKARRAYAQRRIAATSPTVMPEVYRGMAVMPGVLDAMEVAATAGGVIPLTGCTAFSGIRQIAEGYCDSAWTKDNSPPGAVPVLMTLGRSKAFDDSVGMWHDQVDDRQGLPYELLTGAPGVRVLRYIPAGRRPYAEVVVKISEA